MTSKSASQSPQEELRSIREQVESLVVQQRDLLKWFRAIHAEQKDQTRILKNIRSVAYFFFVLSLLSLLAGCCAAINVVSTLSNFSGY
ncbi:hypothetical protein DRJ17_07250 [Candidatus Woesearchaeota archaeon]|nr:MAG: hypothetical protein DRJ17_07250 [Candidatus Woesearchaeota archaeon]